MIVGAGLFEIFVGAIFSFIGALAIIWFAQRLLRSSDGRARECLLVLPALKLVHTVSCGVPADAFFWERAATIHRDLGAFRLAFGFERPFVPVVECVLGALAGGHLFRDSAAGVLAMALTHLVDARVPAAIGFTMAAVGALRLALFIARITRARLAHDATLARAELVFRRRVGLREAAIAVVSDVSDVPFAAGLVRPVVFFSSATWRALEPAERDAVIEHELAHHRAFDLVVVGALAALGAFFWFVPGLAWLTREVRHECELGADRGAVARGADASVLASALVRVAQIEHGLGFSTLGLAGGTSLVARRVARLIAPSGETSRARAIALSIARVVLVSLVAITVARATTLANP